MEESKPLHIYLPESGRSFPGGGMQVLGAWWARRGLLAALVRRDILTAYRGSMLGLLWSVIKPLVTLAIYTVVFGAFFKMQWRPGGDRPGEFPLMLFCGLVPYQFFNDVLGRSAGMIVSSPNYVKKVAFPVELFPCVAAGNALHTALLSMLVLAAGAVLFLGGLSPLVLLVPLLWLPLLVITLALSLAAAALGVFIRDLPHLIGIVLNLLFFLTPIIYPESFVPHRYRILVTINPLADAAENFRRVFVQGAAPDWASWGAFLAAGAVFLFLAAAWFDVIRRRFSDVL